MIRQNRKSEVVSVRDSGTNYILNHELTDRLSWAWVFVNPAFDARRERIYWAEEVLDGLSAAVFKSSLSGFNDEQVVAVDHEIQALALDSIRNVLYWISYRKPGVGEQDPKYGLHRFALDQGTDVEDLIVKTGSDGRFLSSSHMALYNP